MADVELEQFKTSISLVEYAGSLGYGIDRKESSRSSIVMRRGGDNDKIIIARGLDRHWIYFSVRDDTDNGSIIDFVSRRKDLTLGRVRQELRPWIGEHPPKSSLAFAADQIKPISPDRQKILRDLSAMNRLETSSYLDGERGIETDILTSKRFAGKILLDVSAHGNIIFPHYDRDGYCGYEIKNKEFTGFALGGTKGLWFSNIFKTDHRLVIAETAIDALSFHCLNSDQNTRYYSVGGAMNPTQPDLITGAVSKMPELSDIIIATDADTPGRMMAGKIETYIERSGRSDITITRAEPPGDGQDWNDQLRKTKGLIPVNDQGLEGPKTKRGMKSTL